MNSLLLAYVFDSIIMINCRKLVRKSTQSLHPPKLQRSLVCSNWNVVGIIVTKTFYTHIVESIPRVC